MARPAKYPVTKIEAGMHMNMLTAMYPDPDKRYWHFRCNCGNYKRIRIDNFYSAHTVSCGCQRNNKHFDKEYIIQKYKRSGPVYEGRRYGFLQVEKYSATAGAWILTCDCGNTVVMTNKQVALQSATGSCGCYQRYAQSESTKKKDCKKSNKPYQRKLFAFDEWRYKKKKREECIPRNELQRLHKEGLKNNISAKAAMDSGMTYGQYMAQKQLKEYEKEWEAIRERFSAMSKSS